MAVVADPEFFEVTAQLLPVLVLASALETRLRLPPDPRDRHRAPGPGYFLRRMAMLGSVVIGEITALVAVAGRPTALETYVVVSVLGLLGVLIMAPHLMEEADVVREHVRGRRRPLTLGLALLGAFVVTLPLLPAVVVALN